MLLQGSNQAMRVTSHYEPEPCVPITIGVKPLDGASSCPVAVRVGETVAETGGGTRVAVGVRVAVGGGTAVDVAAEVGRGVPVLVAPIGKKVGAGALTPIEVAVGFGVDSPPMTIGTNGVWGALTAADSGLGPVAPPAAAGELVAPMVVKPDEEPGAATSTVGMLAGIEAIAAGSNAVVDGSGVGEGAGGGGAD